MSKLPVTELSWNTLHTYRQDAKKAGDRKRWNELDREIHRRVQEDEVPISTGDSISSIVSPDAPTVVNGNGGAQSDVPVRFDLIDGRAMFAMAAVLDHGAKKYGANNWRKIPIEDHLNHLLMHTYAYLAGDRTDEHLSHILCRATFANGVALAPLTQLAE